MAGATTTIQYFTPPTECPSCKGALQRDGEYLVCRNDDCEAQSSGAIKRWVKKIGVLHVGETLIQGMVDAFPFILDEDVFKVRFGVTYDEYATLPPTEQAAIKAIPMDPADLYCLDADLVSAMEIGGRKVGGSGSKALSNLDAKKTLPLHVIVGSVGINLIGRSMAKVIVDAGYNSLSLMLKARVVHPMKLQDGTMLPALASIPGMGSTKAQSFYDGFQSKAGLIAKLISDGGIKVQTVGGPLVGKSFCLTGFRDAALVAAIEQAGGTVKSGVSKGLDYLICVDKTSTSGKMKKALKVGTTLLEPEEVWALVGNKQ